MVMVFIGLPPVAPTSLQSLLCRRLRYSDNGFSSAGAVLGGVAEHFTSRQPMSSGQPARRGGQRRMGGNGLGVAGRAWWLWEWLRVVR